MTVMRWRGTSSNGVSRRLSTTPSLHTANAVILRGAISYCPSPSRYMPRN